MLVIIGLIIGGILVGADLIKVATLRAQISQINRYSAAMATFQTKYGTLPGDMPASLAAQNGFMSRTGLPGGGDGNGVIEGGPGLSNNYYGWNIGTGESVLFWDDLTSAGMIDQGFSVAPNNVLPPNTTSPRGKLSGIYLALWSSCYNNGSVVDCIGKGDPGSTYLAISGVHATRTTCVPGLTTSQAFEIDSKVDDGAPMSGAIQAFTPVSTTSNYADWYVHASTDSSSTCFNDSTNTYSKNINSGAAMNCGVSLKLR